MSGAQAVFEAAGVGHRITHEDDLPEPKEVLPRVVEHVAAAMAHGDGGASLSAKLGAQDQQQGGEAGDCPGPTGKIEEGSPDTFLGPSKRPAAVVDDDMVVPCEDCSDGPIVTGAAHVFVNGKPWARRMDPIDCGAYVGEGEPTVLIGGEPSAEPGKPQIDLAHACHLALPGGADVAAELGHELAGGSHLDELPATEVPGVQIGKHLAEGDHAGLIALLAKSP
jgi:uncharacterized Zn-binding protein involved in type VI secretion